jgi:hypothetical protein
MSANGAVARAAKPSASEHGYLNGKAIDGNTIETLARSSDVIEPEPVEDAERFDAPPSGKRDGEAKTRPASRDGARS